MTYLAQEEINSMGFKNVGKNVKISDKAIIYDHCNIEIGDNSRIDDYCLISGRVSIGRFCHITPMCLIAGGQPGVFISDYCTLAYGVKIFSQTDDYSGESLTNSTIPKKYKHEKLKAVHIRRLTIIGAGSTILPGTNIAEGCAIGAMTLVNKNTLPWGIYAGIPAKRIKERSQLLLGKLHSFELDLQSNMNQNSNQ